MQGIGLIGRLEGEMQERVSTDEPEAVAGAAAQSERVEPSSLLFADFYLATHAEMVRLAFLLTGSEETAQDLVQDAFVRVFRTYARVDQPRAYLRRSVVNACTSHHRSGFRRRRAAAAITPGTAHLGADELFDVLAILPARQRAAIVLRYWHDLDEQQIAEALGCRPGTVGSLLHRALVRLREVIEP